MYEQAETAPLKILEYTKGTVFKLLLLSQCRKIPQRIQRKFGNNIFPNWNKINFSKKKCVDFFRKSPTAENRTFSSKNNERDPFVTLNSSPGNFISGLRYIRNSLCPVFSKSGIGCFIVEGDSFTAQMQYVDGQKGLCQN